MGSLNIVILLANIALTLGIDRKWACLPLLCSAALIPNNQLILLGPLHFSDIRVLIFFGFVRIFIRSERIFGPLNLLDKLVIGFAVWSFMSSFFYGDITKAIIFRSGLIFNTCGPYFLFRIFCQSPEDVRRACFIATIMLVPTAVGMCFERFSERNIFSVFADTEIVPQIREGLVRAQGPFAHAIVAGTVGGVCLPLVACYYRQRKMFATVSALACLAIVFSSSSSGPILSLMTSLTGMGLFKYRKRMPQIRWATVAAIISVALLMNAPIYYLLARIDLTGGSTGWHRAFLIESAMIHLDEWWFSGTEATRHWMPTGVYWSEDSADITNHYLRMGVIGGLPLLVILASTMFCGFRSIGQKISEIENTTMDHESILALWAIGSSLFAHVVSCIGMSYFDQSICYLYFCIALIASWHNVKYVDTLK
jgi:hypothetical protein